MVLSQLSDYSRTSLLFSSPIAMNYYVKSILFILIQVNRLGMMFVWGSLGHVINDIFVLADSQLFILWFCCIHFSQNLAFNSNPWHSARCCQIKENVFFEVFLPSCQPFSGCNLISPKLTPVADCKAADYNGDGKGDDEDPAQGTHPACQPPHGCVWL